MPISVMPMMPGREEGFLKMQEQIDHPQRQTYFRAVAKTNCGSARRAAKCGSGAAHETVEAKEWTAP
jgi:hypothetical protein